MSVKIREFLAKATDATLKELAAKYPPRSLQPAPAACQPPKAASNPRKAAKASRKGKGSRTAKKAAKADSATA